MRHTTVNDEFDKVKWTGWCTYIPGLENLTTCNGDMCTIQIFLVRFDLEDNHGVANLVSSVVWDICELDELEGVCALGLLNLFQYLGRLGQVN